MPRSKRLQRRPSTPNLALQQKIALHFTANPASPPETPTTSPHLSRKSSLKPRHQPPFGVAVEDDPSIKPVGDGHQFSYQPVVIGPEQLSPKSSSSSDVAVDDDSDEEGDDISESPSVASIRNVPHARIAAIINCQSPLPRPTVSQISDEEEEGDESENADDESEEQEDDESEEEDDDGDVELAQPPSAPDPPFMLLDLIIEELHSDDSDWDAASILHPYEIESTRSRSSSWHNLDRSMKDLNCSVEVSSEDEKELDDFDEMAFYKQQAEIKRRRRVSMSSSFGKRTHSELSDSDDEYAPLDVHEVGSSARRMRKRLHRTSLLFHDPPEQIREEDEPDSSEDEALIAEQTLAKELPYWTVEIMEMDSP